MLDLRPICLMIFLILSGCSGALVKRGDTYAELGQWMQAVEAYSRAHEVRPNVKEIESKLERARDQAVLQEVALAKKALASGALKVAWNHVYQATRVHPNEPTVKQIRTNIREAAGQKVRSFIVDESWDDAYAIWGLLRRYDSGSALVEVLDKELAEAMISRAELYQHDLRFWEARELYLELGRRQPSHAREVEIRIKELNERWVIGSRSQSVADETKGRYASALLWAAVAAGLSKHRDDHQRRQRLRALFLRKHGVVIGTYLQGDSRRVRRLKMHLDHSLSWKQVVRWTPGARNAELAGRILLERPKFDDTFMVRLGSQTYVAGTKKVPNPRHAKQLEAIQILAQRLNQTLRLVSSLEGEMVLYDYEIQSLQVGIPNLRSELEVHKSTLANATLALSRVKESLRESQEAQASLDRHEAKRATLAKSIQELEAKLLTPASAGAGESPTPVSDKDLGAKIKQLKGELEALGDADPVLVEIAGKLQTREAQRKEVAERVVQHQRTVDQFSADLSEREAKLLASQEEERAVRQELNDLDQEHRLMQADYEDLLFRFSRIPETVDEDILEVFNYEIRDWTRVCSVKADMSRVTPPQRDMQQILHGTSRVADASNPGHRMYGVVPDPLLYPKSKTRLIEEADDSMQSHVKDWMKRALSGVRAERLARAQREMGRDREAAAADFLVAWMLSPRTKPAGFEKFVEQYYGKMDMSWFEVR